MMLAKEYPMKAVKYMKMADKMMGKKHKYGYNYIMKMKQMTKKDYIKMMMKIKKFSSMHMKETCKILKPLIKRMKMKGDLDYNMKGSDKDMMMDDMGSGCTYVDQTKDKCRHGGVVTVGGQELRPGNTITFEHKHTSRKWAWWCGNSLEKARIHNANKIRASFDSRGTIVWTGYSCRT